jgi:predicted phage terminase large subunit-like protein
MTASPNCTEDDALLVAKANELLTATVGINGRFIPVQPTPPQALFLTVPVREVMYGGAGGGGKSVALLAAALQYVHVPGYAALLLRRTFPDLNLPGALIPMAHEWLQGTDAQWNDNEKQWTFPSGATVNFGYLQTEVDKYRYKSSEFQFIGFDELTQFTQTQYRYLFTRLRRKAGVQTPLRMRSATNPGGPGHDWVFQRFIQSVECDGMRRLFIPAQLEDNPYLDAEAYEESLAETDPVTRRQMRHGDWYVRPEGNLFKRHWFKTIDADRVPQLDDVVRNWDLAATAEEEGQDPDYVAGVAMGCSGRSYFILHVVRDRLTPKGVDTLIYNTAVRDGKRVKVRVEQEGAASGKIVRYHYLAMLDGFDARFTGIPRNSKLTRAGPFSAACERGDVYIVRGVWNDAYLDELCAFPQEGVHDDQVDASGGAYAQLAGDPKPWGSDDLQRVFAGGRLAPPAKKSAHELLMEKLTGGRN